MSRLHGAMRPRDPCCARGQRARRCDWHDASERVCAPGHPREDHGMRQRIVATTLALGLLVLGLVALGGGGAVAQVPRPRRPSQRPRTSPRRPRTRSPPSTPSSTPSWPSSGTRLPGLVCSAERDTIAQNYDPSQQAIYPRDATQALVDAVQVSISDRSVTLVSSTADQATVRLGGTLVWKVSDDALRTFVDALAADLVSDPDPGPARQRLPDVQGFHRLADPSFRMCRSWPRAAAGCCAPTSRRPARRPQRRRLPAEIRLEPRTPAVAPASCVRETLALWLRRVRFRAP